MHVTVDTALMLHTFENMRPITNINNNNIIVVVIVCQLNLTMIIRNTHRADGVRGSGGRAPIGSGGGGIC